MRITVISMHLLLRARDFCARNALAVSILLAVVLANAAGLYPELFSRMDKNDNISHFAIIQRIVQAVQQGRNPLDFWSPEWCAGFPIVRVYQTLAHDLVALVYFLFGGKIPLLTV